MNGMRRNGTFRISIVCVLPRSPSVNRSSKATLCGSAGGSQADGLFFFPPIVFQILVESVLDKNDTLFLKAFGQKDKPGRAEIREIFELFGSKITAPAFRVSSLLILLKCRPLEFQALQYLCALSACVPACMYYITNPPSFGGSSLSQPPHLHSDAWRRAE